MTKNNNERLGGETEHKWEVKGIASKEVGPYGPLIVLQCMDCGKARITSKDSNDEFGIEYNGVFYDGW